MFSLKNPFHVFGSLTLVGLAASLVGIATQSSEASVATALAGTTGASYITKLLNEKGVNFSIETLKFIGGLSTNIIASDVRETLEKIAKSLSEGISDQNHDITKAVRQAILAVIQSNLAEMLDAAEKESLQKLINTDEAGWAWIELLEKDSLEGISEENIHSFFSQKVEDIAKITSPISREQWKSLLREMERRNGIFLTAQTQEKISESLYEKFPQSLREVFAQDFADNGKAYSKLLLNLLGDIRASLHERFDKLESTQKEVLDSQQKNFPKIIENQQRVADLLVAYVGQNGARRNKTVKPILNKRLTYGGKSVNLPSDWRLITRDFLNEKKTSSAENLQKRAINYFDGISPIWNDALSPLIPKREIVGGLVKKLKNSVSSGGISVTLLLGAGGEGKTTIFLQSVCELVETENNLNVIWQDTAHNNLLKTLQNIIGRSSENWLIVVDEAYTIAKNLYGCVENFHREGKQNVHFFLCSRTADWKNVKNMRNDWGRYANFETIYMPKLTLGDAEKIVGKWFELGEHGMKKLYGKSVEESAEELLKAASRETFVEEKSSENSLLGALIYLREGRNLADHLTSVLKSLSEVEILKNSDLTLLDAFAYIAVLDAEGYPLVTKNILAKVFNCSVGKVKEKIIARLADEAVAFKYEKVVLTRHRLIAENSVKILEEEFNKDLEAVLIDLIQAAEYILKNEEFDAYNAPKWTELPRHYFNKGGDYRFLGIELIRTFIRIHPEDCYFLNNLSRMLREMGNAEESANIFVNADARIRTQRSFYSEWATSYGKNHKYALDAWLTGIALADNSFDNLDIIDAKVCLNSLATVFLELLKKHNLEPIKLAFGAACGLGVKLENSSNLKPAQLEKFKKTHQSLVDFDFTRKKMNISDMSFDTALESIKDGLIAAWSRREAELPNWVVPADSFTFEQLRSFYQQ